MLLVLSRSPRAWLLREMVPNLGFSLEQQAGAIVRELYWPEVGVAIQRTTSTDAGQAVSWLEVFRADPDGLCDSDEDEEKESTETASSFAVPPVVVPGLPSPQQKRSQGSCASTLSPGLSSASLPNKVTTKYPTVHQAPGGLGGSIRSSSTSAASDEPCEASLAPPRGRDFGPPRAARQEANRSDAPGDSQRLAKALADQQKNAAEAIAARRCLEQARDENEALRRSCRRTTEALAAANSRRSEAEERGRHEVAELCQEAGRLTVSLGLAEEKQSKSEALAMRLSRDLASLREEKRASDEEVRTEAAKVARLRSELETMSTEILERDAACQAQRDEFAKKLEREASIQERAKGELIALRHELVRGVEASRKEGEKARAAECERLHGQLRAEADEVARWRSEAAAARVARPADQTSSALAKELRIELGKAEAAFTEELSSVRARLAAAERRNRELLEDLQSTLQAGRPPVSAPVPVALPDPPTSLPQQGAVIERDSLWQHREQEERWRQQLWSRQRHCAENDVWQLHEQQKEKEEQLEQLKRQQEMHQRQLLKMQPKEMPIDSTIAMNSDSYRVVSTSYTEKEDGSGSISSSTSTLKRSSAGRGSRLTRLPSAPSLELDSTKIEETGAEIGAALRRAARQRRAAKTRSLDDEYVRFVRDARRTDAASLPIRVPQDASRLSRHEAVPARTQGDSVEPFVLSDLVAGQALH